MGHAALKTWQRCQVWLSGVEPTQRQQAQRPVVGLNVIGNVPEAWFANSLGFKVVAGLNDHFMAIRLGQASAVSGQGSFVCNFFAGNLRNRIFIVKSGSKGRTRA
jgi:hypothetical protein